MGSKAFLVFHDSLSLWQLEEISKNHKLIFIESHAEFSRIPHHKQKLVFFISAMRNMHMNFPESEYIITDLSITALIQKQLSQYTLSIFRPGNYADYMNYQNLNIVENQDFLCNIEEFQKLNPKVMETFYRYMRKKTGFLMHGNKPQGGKWNFDQANRKRMPANVSVPDFFKIKPNKTTEEVIQFVNTCFAANPGSLDHFWTGVTREDALAQLTDFVQNRLDSFGMYQDAMRMGEYICFHSGLSHYLNVGLLSPREICEAVISAHVPLESKEGYIRQIIGWREFTRGIYWRYMPEYKDLNPLKFNNDLPSFYWTGKTEMNCMKNALDSTLHYSYSHHIQRLMITGNYAALISASPAQVNEWYLSIYLDAHEWVQLPNTHGMALHADGGLVGTKPYICSASYINKMSNSCKTCKYNHKSADASNACPFNFLYWNFLMAHDFSKNPRMSLPYCILGKMTQEYKESIKKMALSYCKKNHNL